MRNAESTPHLDACLWSPASVPRMSGHRLQPLEKPANRLSLRVSAESRLCRCSVSEVTLLRSRTRGTRRERNRGVSSLLHDTLLSNLKDWPAEASWCAYGTALDGRQAVIPVPNQKHARCHDVEDIAIRIVNLGVEVRTMQIPGCQG